MNFSELIKARYSVRSYKNEPIEKEKLEAVLAAGLCAPTARNFQPQRIYVASSVESRQALASVCRFTFGAPTVLVLCYDGDRCWQNKLAQGVHSGETDAAIVGTHMMLAATELGLGTCWVAYFNPDDVKKALGLPENVTVTALIPIGYPADDAEPLPLHFESRSIEDTVTEL